MSVTCMGHVCNMYVRNMYICNMYIGNVFITCVEHAYNNKVIAQTHRFAKYIRVLHECIQGGWSE